MIRKVSIIVPVYKGLGPTRACLESVLANRQQVPFELVVVDDASPEPEISAWLDQLASAGKITSRIIEPSGLA